MKTNVTITLREAHRHADWDRFCETTGVDPYALAEGGDPDAEYTLTLEQAERCGLRLGLCIVQDGDDEDEPDTVERPGLRLDLRLDWTVRQTADVVAKLANEIEAGMGTDDIHNAFTDLYRELLGSGEPFRETMLMLKYANIYLGVDRS